MKVLPEMTGAGDRQGEGMCLCELEPHAMNRTSKQSTWLYKADLWLARLRLDPLPVCGVRQSHIRSKQIHSEAAC